MKISSKNHPVELRRIFFFLIAALLYSFTGILAFQDRGLIVHFSGATEVNMRPGQLATLSVRVTNTSKALRTYSARVIMPNDWRPITKESPFDLLPNEGDTRLLGFAVPHDAAGGLYEVRYVVTDNAVPPNEAEASISVSVAAVRKLVLSLFDVPRYVVAGATYKSVFLLSNKGNVGGPVRLKVLSRPEFRARLDSTVLAVAAGRSREVSVVVQSDAVLSEKMRHTVELTAEMVPDSTVTAQATSVVEVIPMVSKIEEPFHKLPVVIKLLTTAREDDYRTQVQVSGAGTLADGRKDYLDFSFRGPDNQAQSIVGQREEYRLRFRGIGYGVFLGDQNFQLSPLTEFGRYGLGGNANVEWGNFRLGGFTNQSRFIVPLQREHGGYLGYQFTEKSRLSLNYMRKRERQESDIMSVRGVVAPIYNTEFEAEYAASEAAGTKDDAYSVRMTGQQSWVSYDVRYILAGPKYTGYYRDLEFISAGLNVLPHKLFRLEAYARQEERNQRRDTTRFYAPRDQYIQIGGSFANYISMYYRTSGQVDLFENSKFDRREEMIQIRLAYGFSTLNVLVNLDIGTTKDKIIQKESPFRRYSLFTNFRPAPSNSYGASVEYTTDRNLYTNEIQERFSGNLSIWSLVADNTQLQLNLYGSRTISPFLQTYTLVDGTFDHIFSNGHRATVRGRLTYFKILSVERDMGLALEYSVPFGVPLSRKTGTGQVRGRVVDIETGKGMSSVVLFAGNSTVVTDRDGNYFFPYLSPEAQFLQIDQSSIGVNRVTTPKTPLQVSVKGGEEIRVDIGVTRSSTATGLLIKYGFDESSQQPQEEKKLIELEGLQGVVLEITNGAEFFRRVTDSRGRFVFADLLPGRWKLTVLEGQMPEYHYLDKESYDLVLKPGGKEAVTFKVLPRKRTIKIIQEGQVLPAKPAEESSTKPPAQPPSKPVEQPAPKSTEPGVSVSSAPQEPELCVIVRMPDKSGYAIQVSWWQSEALASRKADAVQKEFGHKAWVEKAAVPKLGTRYRVMLGVFKTRTKAAEVCRNIRESSK